MSDKTKAVLASLLTLSADERAEIAEGYWPALTICPIRPQRSRRKLTRHGRGGRSATRRTNAVKLRPFRFEITYRNVVLGSCKSFSHAHTFRICSPCGAREDDGGSCHGVRLVQRPCGASHLTLVGITVCAPSQPLRSAGFRVYRKAKLHRLRPRIVCL